MRFAITATDNYLGVYQAFVQAGWQPVKLFVPPCDNRVIRNRAITAAAQQAGLPIQLSRMTAGDLEALGRAGCEALVVASYNWKIPDWSAHLKYAVNFHASPLPEGRGPYPQVRALLEGRRAWAITCHKLAQEFDTGEILAQEGYALDDIDTHDSLDLKNQMAAKRLARRVAGDFANLWNGARAQEAGSYWPRWKPEERALDFSRSVDEVMRTVRAFGRIECTATVNGVEIFVRQAVGWKEAHDATPGQAVHSDGSMLVVAAKDGFVGIVEWSLINPDAVMDNRLKPDA